MFLQSRKNKKQDGYAVSSKVCCFVPGGDKEQSQEPAYPTDHEDPLMMHTAPEGDSDAIFHFPSPHPPHHYIYKQYFFGATILKLNWEFSMSRGRGRQVGEKRGR